MDVLHAEAPAARVLAAIRRRSGITRREIAARAGLGEGTVFRITRELLDAGLIVGSTRAEAVEGRPPDLLEMRAGAGYAVGLALDGVFQKAVVCDLAGTVLVGRTAPSTVALPTERMLESLDAMAGAVVADAGIAAGSVLGVGVNLQAIVDAEAGTAFVYPGTAGWSDAWSDLPIRDLLAARLPWERVLVEDTVRGLAAAEAQLVRGDQDEDFAFVLADVGIGAALVLGGRPYIGPTGMAGELGHVPVGGDIPCSCGSHGCVSHVATVRAVLARVRERLSGVGVHSRLASRGGRTLEIGEVLGAADDGDKLAYQVVTEAGQELGRALSVLLNLLGFRLIVVGGAMAASRVYLESMLHAVRLSALPQVSHQVRIEPSRLGGVSDARSAANLVLSDALSGRALDVFRTAGAASELDRA